MPCTNAARNDGTQLGIERIRWHEQHVIVEYSFNDKTGLQPHAVVRVASNEHPGERRNTSFKQVGEQRRYGLRNKIPDLGCWRVWWLFIIGWILGCIVGFR